jgi:hypothetical protein
MPYTSTILIVTIFLAVDVVVLWAIRQWVKMTFAEIVAAFPSAEPRAGAVRRRLQSISIDLMNFGWCFVVSADEGAVHFAPNAFGRLVGARAFSVPWEAVKLEGKRRGRWFQKARIGKWTLTGPAWALKLAEGEAS